MTDVYADSWLLLRALARDVARAAPPGLDNWKGLGEIVSSADGGFLLALERWAADPMSHVARAGVRKARADVLGAWRVAARHFEAQREATP